MYTCLAVPSGRTKATPVLIALAAIAVVLIAAAPAAARSTTRPAPVLAQGAGMGDRPSPAVRTVQRVLDRRGYDLGAPGVDGRFGPITDAAVRHAQSDSGLVADGLVGPKTRRALGLPRTARRGPGKAVRRPGTRAPGTKSPTKTPAGAKPPPGANPSASAKPPAAQPQPATSPAGRAHAHDGDADRTPWILAAIAAIVAILVVGGALVAAGRRPGRLRRRLDAERSLAARALLVEAQGQGVPQSQPGPARDVRADRDGAPTAAAGAGLATAEPVIGYVTLAPDVPRSDADAPARAIAQACDQSGRRLVDVLLDRETGRALERPALNYALRQIAEGNARGLVVAELRRLSRSNVELGVLMEWFMNEDATLVGLDIGLDTTTPQGREAATALVTLGEWERRRGERRMGRGATADVGAPRLRPELQARDALAGRRKGAEP